ncbi:MAG: hypothetical protein KGZ81_12500 [Flavobacteriales bacterium]|nr:hypothetical protein [Flavobacteriales bacterium]
MSTKKKPAAKTAPEKAPEVEAPKVEATVAEAPETEVPEAPEAEAPETEVPEAPEAEAPETEVPEAPEAKAPETEAPEVEAPKVKSLAQRAKEVFDMHPAANACFFTSDGTAFLHSQHARIHGETLKDSRVTTILKSEV